MAFLWDGGETCLFYFTTPVHAWLDGADEGLCDCIIHHVP